MDTIALWEQEIEESNKYHFFEETTNILNYLMESIEIDYQLLEMGIITEETENEESDNTEDNKEENTEATDDNKYQPKANVLKTIKDKIVTFFVKLLGALGTINKKIQNFITEKIRDFKQKNIIQKFTKGKLDNNKLVEKVNKVKLFDPEKVFNTFKDIGLFDNFQDLTEMLDSDTGTALVEVISSMSSLLTPNDVDTVNKARRLTSVIVHIDKDNAQSDIVKLYTNTELYISRLKENIDKTSNEIKKLKNEVDSIKDKEDIKAAKHHLKLCNTVFKGEMQLSKHFVKQANFLMLLMAGFLEGAGNVENSGEKKEEENK